MGLKITTIEGLPLGDRDYYVYFLDYGWDDEITEALYRNFDKMAARVNKERAIVLAGLHRQEFANEVLSWHHINAEAADDLLPALLISNCDPRTLSGSPAEPKKFVLIPLKGVCKGASDVTNLLNRIAADTRAGKPIANFEKYKTVERSSEGLADMIIARPTFAGVGIDLVKVFKEGARRMRKRQN